jgi:uncharacterized phage protein (TIGR02216 family)|tara:strand:- start:1618 stop:1773 length:156 start_codon:yes stop_codon:yes gene_type:complete
MIGISPSEFWNMSPVEIYSAIAGFQEFNGASDSSSPMDRDRLSELMELYPD